MSRITGSDAQRLMEAYAAVYAPQQEVVEEVVEEETEQIDEIAVNFGGQAALAAKQKELAQQRQSSARIDALRQQRFGSGGSPSAKGGAKTRAELTGSARPAAPASSSSTNPTQSALTGKVSYNDPKKLSADAAKDLKNRYPQNFRNSSGGDGGNGRGGYSQPPATAKQKPAPAKPAIGKLGSTTFERRTPTSAELKAAQAARASGAGPEKALQAAKAAGAAKVAPSAPEVKQTATLAAAPKPVTVAPRATGSKKPGSTFEQYDAYDVVLEYLLNNGHADTVDEAHYVMMEMDGETIADIVEGSYEDRIAANNKKYDRNRKRAAQRAAERNAARDRGETGAVRGVGYVTPRRESETYRDSAGVERHKSGAKMPKEDN